jgi:hypothetical protein
LRSESHGAERELGACNQSGWQVVRGIQVEGYNQNLWGHQVAENKNRRLSDKLREALERAVGPERREVAEKLRVLYQEVLDQEAAFARNRRNNNR